MSGKKDSPDPLKDNYKRFNSLEWLQTSTESLCWCLPTTGRRPPFMWQVQVLLSCLIQGRSAKFWGRSKAILPQSGVAIICKRPQDRIRLFDPTNAPRPPLPCPASCPPICFPQFPSHPSSPQFVNFRLEGTRRRRNNRGSCGTYWGEGHLVGVEGEWASLLATMSPLLAAICNIDFPKLPGS